MFGGQGIGGGVGGASRVLLTLSADILRAKSLSIGLFCRLPLMGVRLGLERGWEEKM